MIQKKYNSIGILSVLLLFGITVGFSSSLPAFAEVDTDKSVYSKGELLKISGSIDFQDNDDRVNIIEIEITDSNNDTIVNEYTPINTDNEFSSSYNTITWEPGDYKITISYNETEEIVEFEIAGSSFSSSDEENDDNTQSNESADDDSNGQQELSSSTSNIRPNPPIDLKADIVSSIQIDLSWYLSDSNDDDSSITGFKIEARINTDPNYSVIVANTGSTDTTYSHTDLTPDTVYAYRVSAINSSGESDPSSSTTVKTPNNNGISSSSSNTEIDVSDVPTDVQAKVISPTSVELSWNPPTQTYDQIIQGYTIKQEIASDTYNEIASTIGPNTNYTLSNLNTDQTYTFVVVANYLVGSSDISEDVTITLTSSSSNNNNESSNNDNDSSSVTPNDDGDSSSIQDDDDNDTTNTSSSPTNIPSQPVDLQAIPISQSRINLSWSAPIDSGDSSLLGYKIESKTSSESDYSVLVTNTGNASVTEYSHTGLISGLTYQYRVSAINSSGESNPSDVVDAIIISIDNNEEQSNTQQQQSTSPTLQPLQVTLNTDKSLYRPNDPILISGTINDSTSTIPLGMRIVSSDGTIVYVRSIAANTDNTFETIISPLQRQSSSWQVGNGEFIVEVTSNGRIKATTVFENEIIGNNNNDDVSDNESSSFNKSETDTQQQSSVNEFITDDDVDTVTSNNKELEALNNQNIALQSANQQLQNENNQLRAQINDLNTKLEQLDVIVKEQMRVMLETLGIS